MDDDLDQIERMAELLHPIAVATGRTWSDDQYTLWVSVLADLPTEAIRSAVARWAGTSENGFPMPATIRRLAVEQDQGQLPGWEEACGRVLWAANRYGSLMQAEARAFLTDVEWRTVRSLGGWEAICESKVADRSILRSQFREHFRATSERAERQRAIPEHLRPKRVPAQGQTLDERDKAALVARVGRSLPDATPRSSRDTGRDSGDVRGLAERAVKSAEKPELPSEDELEQRRERQMAAARRMIAARGEKTQSAEVA